MNILTYSSLYPNPVDPTHGIFVERRLRRYLEFSSSSASVLAPVPWFPFRARVFGKYAEFAKIPCRASRAGIEIRYPRFRLLPKVGMLSAPCNMARATLATVRSIAEESGPIDLIDAHYFYPDGVAAAKIATKLGIPFVVTARGSDINTIGAMDKPRRMILDAADKAHTIIAVSGALKNALVDMGVYADKIRVLRNGVDLVFFQPGDRAELRRRLGLVATTFISVGALKEAKGHDVAIRALAHIDGANLVVIGAGPFEKALKSLLPTLGLEGRVKFTGRLEPDALLEYYQAADALLLVSRREGMPNVVLESIACGTPVIAADVGGIAEVITEPAIGELLGDRRPESVADAWRRLVQRGLNRVAVRRAAERLSWDPTVRALHEVFSDCAASVGH